jgi:large subunit ribosomal protein L9
MKIVLRKEIESLGEVDNVVKVADGYARNYLFPKNLAVLATKNELVATEKRVAKREKALEARRNEFEELAKKLSSLEISISADASEGGKLFGSVSTQDIAAAIKEEGIDVLKRKISIPNPIKIVGEHSAHVKIYKDIAADIKIKVEAKK